MKTLRSSRDIAARFPKMPESEIATIAEFNKRFRFGISEEMLDYLTVTEAGPLRDDPLARLYFPFPDLLMETVPGAYNPEWDNWEMPEDFPIRDNYMWQHKYYDRAVCRADSCDKICLDCFEAIRVLDKEGHKKRRPEDWLEGIAFLHEHPEITEVIFSGGEPLLAPDNVLECRFADVRTIQHVRIIRIHTARAIHDTDRLSDEFAQLCSRHRVSEIALHVVHPRQVTTRFVAAVERLARGAPTMLRMAHIPLKRGVNDNTQILAELCTKLVECGVKPYYFLHPMPSTLGAKQWRFPVQQMVEIVRPLLGRGFSHVRAAEPIIVARGGKKTIPMQCGFFYLLDAQIQNEKVWAIDDTHQPLTLFGMPVPLKGYPCVKMFYGTPDFVYTHYQDRPVVVFKNWKGEWEMYPDAPE